MKPNAKQDNKKEINNKIPEILNRLPLMVKDELEQAAKAKVRRITDAYLDKFSMEEEYQLINFATELIKNKNK